MNTVALVKITQLLGAVLLAGGPIFLVLIWRPAMAAAAPAGDRAALDGAVSAWVRRLTLAGAVLLGGGAVADLLRLAALLTRVPLLAGENLAMAWDLVRASDAGRLMALRPLLACATLICLPWCNAGGGRAAVAVALGGAALATFGLTGHAMATPGGWVAPVLADLIHLIATAAWYGGLLLLAFLPWRRLADPAGRPLLARVVSRFSRLGLLAVALLALTGLFMAVQRLYGPRALVEHSYGSTLLIKLAFLAGVLVLAGANRLWAEPRLRGAGPGGAAGALRWLVTGEAVLGLAVLAAAGTLSVTSPPLGEPVRLTATLAEGRIDPAVLEVPSRQPVRLTVLNQGTMAHSYVIRQVPHDMADGGHDHGGGTDMAVFVQPGRREAVQFIPRRAGTYEVYCMVAGHREAGETARVIVRE